MLLVLTNLGADLSAQDKDGRTILHAISARKNSRTAKMLMFHILHHHTVPSTLTEDNTGETALDLCGDGKDKTTFRAMLGAKMIEDRRKAEDSSQSTSGGENGANGRSNGGSVLQIIGGGGGGGGSYGTDAPGQDVLV